MKKIILIIISITIICLVYQKYQKEDLVEIPSDAIRIRIIPNSNTPEDQYIKGKVKDYVEKEMYEALKNIDNVEKARKIINNKLDSLNEGIEKVLLENNYDKNFEIKYGDNYFPAKEYKGTIYEEGYYESLVVSLGSAKGDNWWCVLFPPLCLLEADESSEVEYKFFVQEMISKIFNH